MKSSIMQSSRTAALLLALLLLPLLSLSAQRTISGKVSSSEDGAPLIGATVVVVGSSGGTITDIEGNYSIQIRSDEDVISYRFVGYVTQDIVIGSRSSLDVLLDLDATEMDEVVVVGYSVQRKNDLTGAISVVSGEELEKSNASSLSQALQGKAAGVSIMSTSGRPGANMNIRVRGIGSINNNAQPLVVVDGVITGTGTLNGLNPDDIESISVLKDAAAAAIYGAQSSNGVILVETKKGKSGQMNVDFSAQIGISNIPKRMNIMNSDEYVNYYEQAYATHNNRFRDNDTTQLKTFPTAYSDSVRAIYNYNYSDWQDLITVKNALSQNYRLGISGGGDRATYMFSGTYIRDEGILMTTWRENVNLRINTTYKVSKRITVGENLSIGIGKSQSEGAGGAFLTSVITSPLMPVYNEDALGGFQGPDPAITGPNERTNPVAELTLNERYNNSNGIFGNIFAEIEFIKGLKFRTNLGINYFNSLRTEWTPEYDLFQRSVTENVWRQSVNLGNKLQWDQILSYTNSIEGHSFSILAGHSMEDQLSNSITGTARDFNWTSLKTLSNGNPEKNGSNQWINPTTGESYFGRLTYDFKGKYLFTGTIRHDGSSKFGPKNKWGTFPAFSVGWKLNEDLLRSVDEINMLKLRFGWGKSGNTPDGSFLYDTYISIYNEHAYTLGTGGESNGNAVFGAAPFYNYGWDRLAWEETAMTNFGLDLQAFSNKLQFSGEYYIKNTSGLLTYLPLSAQYGLSGDAQPPIVNLGSLSNRGFEFNASYRNMEGEFHYNISANLTTIKNQVDDIPQSPYFSDNGINVAQMGNTVGSYYGYVAERILTNGDFVSDASGNPVMDEAGRYTPLFPAQEDYTAPGDIKYMDLNRDGKINASDMTIIGKPIPDFEYGLSIDLEYRGFDVNLHFRGAQNMQLYNQFYSRGGLASGDVTTKDENKLVLVNDYWTPDNGVTDQTGIGLTDYNRNNRVSSWWLDEASFFRLRNLQIGYTFPEQWMNAVNMTSLRVYVGGENLLVWTKYRGYDPEVSSQDPMGGNSGLIDTGAYPIPRIWTIGLSAKF